MKPVGEPDAGNPHVRFDERGVETERWPNGPQPPRLSSTLPLSDEASGGQKRATLLVNANSIRRFCPPFCNGPHSVKPQLLHPLAGSSLLYGVGARPSVAKTST